MMNTDYHQNEIDDYQVDVEHLYLLNRVHWVDDVQELMMAIG